MSVGSICTQEGNPRQPRADHEGAREEKPHEHLPLPGNRTRGGEDDGAPTFIELRV